MATASAAGTATSSAASALDPGVADAIVERLMARIRQEHLASASPQQTSAVNQPESAGVPATCSASEGEAAGRRFFI